MNRSEEAYRDAWLAELWPVCRGADRQPQTRTHMCKQCGKPVRHKKPADSRRKFCHTCRPTAQHPRTPGEQAC